MPIPHPPPPFGLRWTANLWGPIPVWSEEPDIPKIESLASSHLGGVDLSACFLAAGAFNKLYTVNVPSTSSSYIFRVTLPLEPVYKTSSEVATLCYLREHTSIPVPAVIAYSCTAHIQNSLGFEWILMEKLPGVPLAEVWNTWDMVAKRGIAECLGEYTKQLRERCTFDAIGSLYKRAELGVEDLEIVVDTDDPKFVIGPAVMMFFFAGKRRALVERNRGPYRHDRQYLLALMQLELEDMYLLQKLAAEPDRVLGPKDGETSDDDEDLLEDAADIVKAIRELLILLPFLFLDDTHSSFVLHHHDLQPANILVDPVTQKITGIVDWECIAALPRWEAAYPKLLYGPEVQEPSFQLEPGDTDECRLETWEFWHRSQL